MCVSCMYTNFYTCFEVKLTKLNENKATRNKEAQARGQTNDNVAVVVIDEI